MSTQTQFLNLPDGKLAYDDQGSGPLIIATSAMIELRSQLRFLVPELIARGFRVVTIDQRGMGESDARWPAYGSSPMADDLIALIRHLDAGPALIYGTSNGAAAAVLAAAKEPQLVSAAVLAAPFVRDGKTSWFQRRMMDLARIPFLTIPAYLSYYPNWEPNRPADFDEHVAALKANLKEPGRRRATAYYLLKQTHREAESRLADVKVPSLVIMGTGDIDWPDPTAEAKWIVERLNSELLLLDGAGHHPDVERPGEIADAVAAFVAALDSDVAAAASR